MVAQSRSGKVDVTLYLTRCDAVVAALHDETQDCEPHRMTERSQLLGVAFEFGRHATVSNIFESAEQELIRKYSKHAGATVGSSLQGQQMWRLRSLDDSAIVAGNFAKFATHSTAACLPNMRAYRPLAADLPTELTSLTI
jgi:hypothetical protein